MLALQHELIMMKKKRSTRPRSASPLALTIATSSSTTTDLSAGAAVMSDVSPSNSNSGELAHSAAADEEEEDMANCLILLARGRSSPPPPAAATATAAVEVYQCKTCSKSFSSFQALGGHRASHKKPNKAAANVEEKKPPLMVMREKQESFVVRERDDGTNLSLQISNCRSSQSKIRVHECSICGAEFGSGQALGGHMRRHRPIPAAAIGGGGGEPQGAKKARNLLSLDLNLPAPEDDQPESKFPFATKEQVIVFAASPLIDCHY